MQKRVLWKQPQATGCADRCAGGACEKRGRFWAVTDAAGRLVCLAVYKKGAQEVLRRLAATTAGAKRRPKPRRKQRGERG